MYIVPPPQGNFHNNGRGILHDNILRADHVGISIFFRGKANNVVAENTANQFEPQIRKTGLRKGVYTPQCFSAHWCLGCYRPFPPHGHKEQFWNTTSDLCMHCRCPFTTIFFLVPHPPPLSSASRTHLSALASCSDCV